MLSANLHFWPLKGQKCHSFVWQWLLWDNFNFPTYRVSFTFSEFWSLTPCISSSVKDSLCFEIVILPAVFSLQKDFFLFQRICCFWYHHTSKKAILVEQEAADRREAEIQPQKLSQKINVAATSKLGKRQCCQLIWKKF